MPRGTANELFVTAGDNTDNNGRYPCATTGSGGTARFVFAVPMRYAALIEAKLVGIVSADAANDGLDIDIGVSLAMPGQDSEDRTVSDTSTVYDLSGLEGQLYEFDLFALLDPAIGPCDIVAVQIDHNAIGGPIDYVGLRILYDGF